MTYVKYALGGAGILATVLGLVYGVQNAGGQGIFLLVASLLPVALVAFGTVVKPTLPRWAAIVSAVSFLIVAMKTRQGDQLQNIMMVAALGLILAIALAVKPDKAKS